MKKFIIQSILFCGLLFIFMVGVFYAADGHADGLYLKFTTPSQKSLILGTSKASQGLHPSVLNNLLKREDIYNYGFTVIHSPYGPAYLESIKNKLDKSSTNGIFIITVDPHSLASMSEDPNDKSIFRENQSAVGQIENVSANPNFDYLINHYPEQYIYLLTRRIPYVSQGFLHKDGLVESGLSTDPKLVEKRVEEKIKNYKEQTKQYKVSEIRSKYLEKTIVYLQQYGNVYLVRLPVIRPLLNLENSIFPNFDQRILQICNQYNLDYLNLTDKVEYYSYDDGNHLDTKSGKLVSREIAEWIKSLNEI